MQTLLTFLQTLDTNATLFINGMHCSYLDNFMMIYTGRFIWIPLYLSLFIVMMRNFPWRVNVACLAVTILLVAVNDQVSSSLIRPFIGRLRPSNPMTSTATAAVATASPRLTRPIASVRLCSSIMSSEGVCCQRCSRLGPS